MGADELPVVGSVPAVRVRAVNGEPSREEGGHVVYWMIMARRTRWNWGLQRAVEVAREREVPLVVLEALRAGHRFACARFHRFVLDGMRDQGRLFGPTKVHYHPYVEPRVGAGRGLLAAWARDAALVVTDDYPTFFLPRMVEAAGRALDVRLEAVDSCGIMPLHENDIVFSTAYHFRRHLHKRLLPHLLSRPKAAPLRLAGKLPRLREPPGEVARKWPSASRALLDGDEDALAALPIDQEVAPTRLHGGQASARRAMRRFVEDGLVRYRETRDDLDDPHGTSGLSPWLHWGHLSSHEVVDAVLRHEEWTPGRVRRVPPGKREGWWGASADAEAFLDQIVTWREVGFQFAARVPDHAKYHSLPEWARKTLAKHASDRREHAYPRRAFEEARTHDDLWNAAQTQLAREGFIHNRARMLWGKKILEWSETPEGALATMFHLNDKYALDGRDANSVSGICWVMGRFDRPWPPEKPVIGVLRSMSTARALPKAKQYVARFAAD